MCRAMEEMRKDERIECALEMLADGMPYEKVAKYSKLSIEEVKELASKKSADKIKYCYVPSNGRNAWR